MADHTRRLNGPMVTRLRKCAADTSSNWDGKITIYPPEARELVTLIDAAPSEPACGYLPSHPSHDFARPDEDLDGGFGPRRWCDGVPGDWQQPMDGAADTPKPIGARRG